MNGSSFLHQAVNVSITKAVIGTITITKTEIEGNLEYIESLPPKTGKSNKDLKESIFKNPRTVTANKTPKVSGLMSFLEQVRKIMYKIDMLIRIHRKKYYQTKQVPEFEGILKINLLTQLIKIKPKKLRKSFSEILLN